MASQLGRTELDEEVMGRDTSSWVSFPSNDRTPHTRKWHRSVMRHRLPHVVRLPPAVIICRVEIVFLAGGWHSCTGNRASEQNSSSCCRAAPPFGASATSSFPLSPTKLPVEFAEPWLVGHVSVFSLLPSSPSGLALLAADLTSTFLGQPAALNAPLSQEQHFSGCAGPDSLGHHFEPVTDTS